MIDGGWHFSQPGWLWTLLLIPLAMLWLNHSAPTRRHGRENEYADTHLMPYLGGQQTTVSQHSAWPRFGWALACSLLILALAGPRLGYRQINPFEAGADLVILLDISASMDVADVAPSRLQRGLQEIQDLAEGAQGIRMGLVVFATIAHVVTPLTEDSDNLVKLLPGISTSMVSLHGSRLSNALELASILLSDNRGDVSRNILLVSDGDFAETGIEQQISELNASGIRLHVLAVGTPEGGQVDTGSALDGAPVVSRLDEEFMAKLAADGGGLMRIAGYRDSDTRDIVADILKLAKARKNLQIKTRVWNEYFYWLLIPAMMVLLLLYRPAGSTREMTG